MLGPPGRGGRRRRAPGHVAPRTGARAMPYAGAGAGLGTTPGGYETQVPPPARFEPIFGAPPRRRQGARTLPAGFDGAGFAREARKQFLGVQAAHDRHDAKALADVMTPELLREIAREMEAERRGAPDRDRRRRRRGGRRLDRGVEPLGERSLRRHRARRRRARAVRRGVEPRQAGRRQLRMADRGHPAAGDAVLNARPAPRPRHFAAGAPTARSPASRGHATSSRPHAGRIVAFASGPFAGVVHDRRRRHVRRRAAGAAPSLTLHVSPLALPALAADPSRWPSLVRADGDPALAATFEAIAQTFPWFVERAFGDVLGPIVGQMARRHRPRAARRFPPRCRPPGRQRHRPVRRRDGPRGARDATSRRSPRASPTSRRASTRSPHASRRSRRPVKSAGARR